MEPLTLQPTFRVSVPATRQELIEGFAEASQQVPFRASMKAAGSCLELMVDQSDQHFWSPHLSVQIQSNGSALVPGDREPATASDAPTELFCRFSPRPEIWTMFMAIYAILLSLIFIAGIFSLVQWMLEERPWALVVIPVGVLSIAGMHTISKVGQKLSADQMQTLKERLDLILETVQSGEACDRH